MKLSQKTLEQLRIIINGDDTPDYRSGPALVDFFNQLGFNDVYGQGFPSRWYYTDEKLKAINGTPELDKCIKATFAVINYIERIPVLDAMIETFNKYLAFDKWSIARENDQITFKKLDRVIIDDGKKDTKTSRESEFLGLKFDANVDAMGLDSNVTQIIKSRLVEAENCVNCKAPLASVILIGSVMEGILLGTASMYPRLFNQAKAAPKEKDGSKVKRLNEWTLNNFIDVAAELKILNPDVKEFSHVLRDFRNYIHPYQQMVSHFSPDEHTALICIQVLKAAIYQIGKYRLESYGGTN